MKTALLVTLVLSLMSVVCVLVFSLTRKDRLRSLYFTVLCAAVGIYLLGYLLEVDSTTLESAVTANKMQNVGIPMIAPLFLLFVLSICQYKLFRQWFLYATFIYSFGIFGMVLFNEYHHLYYTSVEYVSVWDMHHMILGHGPLYNIQQAVTNVCTLLAYAALFYRMRTWSAKARKQMRYIVVGALFPFVFNLLYFTRFISQAINPTPIAMTLTAIFCTVSIMRYRLFDIVDIASETAIQTMDDAIVIVDTDWCYRFSNCSAALLFPGLSSILDAQHIDTVKDWPQELSRSIGVGKITFELGRGEQKQYFRAHVSAVGSGTKAIGWSIVIRDITETTRLLEQMKLLATTDALTDIYNRRYFIETVQREMAKAKRREICCALSIMDLDHFKVVNDTYGHQAGDAVLAAVANVVKKQLREYDVFARYGGEEFSLFIVDIIEKDAENFALRLCQSIADLRIPYNQHILQITASFGLVVLDWDCTLEEAIIAADEAMYRAKQGGRNQVKVGVVHRVRVNSPFLTD